jgi:plastocyanin
MTGKVFLALLLSAGVFAPAAPAARAQPAAPQTLHVEIHNFEFAPTRIEAHVGDVIEFTNRDFAPHTATDNAAKWDTKQIDYAKSASIVATSAGSFAYHCHFHPQMKGLLVVTAR